MLNGGTNTILPPPFGGLSDEVPPVLTFLRLCFEQFFVLWVIGGGISDDLERDVDRYLCVSNGGRNCLSYGRNEAPEDI